MKQTVGDGFDTVRKGEMRTFAAPCTEVCNADKDETALAVLVLVAVDAC